MAMVTSHATKPTRGEKDVNNKKLVLQKSFEEQFADLLDKHVDAETDNQTRLSEQDILQLRQDHWPGTRPGAGHQKQMERYLKKREEQPWTEYLKPIIDKRDRKLAAQRASNTPAPLGMRELVAKFKRDVLQIDPDAEKNRGALALSQLKKLDDNMASRAKSMTASEAEKMIDIIAGLKSPERSARDETTNEIAPSERKMSRSFERKLSRRFTSNELEVAQMCSAALAVTSRTQKDIDDKMMVALEKIRKHQEMQNLENEKLAEKCKRIYARQNTKFAHGLHDPNAASSSDVPIKQLSKQWEHYVSEQAIEDDLQAKREVKSTPTAAFVQNMLKDYQDLSKNIVIEGSERREKERQEEMASLTEQLQTLEIEKKKRRAERQAMGIAVEGSSNVSPRSPNKTPRRKMKDLLGKRSQTGVAVSMNDSPREKKFSFRPSAEQTKKEEEDSDESDYDPQKFKDQKPAVSDDFAAGFRGRFSRATSGIRVKNQMVEKAAQDFGSMDHVRERIEKEKADKEARKAASGKHAEFVEEESLSSDDDITTALKNQVYRYQTEDPTP